MSDEPIGVLIVESDESQLELLRRAFAPHGGEFCLSVAAGLEEALSILEAPSVNAIVTSLRLCDGSGCDLLQRGEPLTLPPVIVTGPEKVTWEAVEVWKAGASDYVIRSKAGLQELPGSVKRAVAERRRIEEGRAEGDARCRTLLENLPISLFRTTPGSTGKILLANRATVELFGYESVEELKGIKACDLYRDPSQREIFSDYLVEHGQVVKRELELKTKDGTILWGALTARAIRNESTDIEYFDCLLEDVTEQKRAEEERSMLEEQLCNTVVDGILTVRDDGEILSLNEAAARLFQSSIERMKGMNLRKACREELLTVAEVTESAIETGEFVREFQVGLSHHGQERTYALSVTPVIAGEAHRAILLIRDITRLRRLERQVSEKSTLGQMIGRSSCMQSVFDMLRDVADSGTTILIEGESGTGKELAAAVLHYHSTRKDGPFIRVNCAALPETLLESELFGHVRGAFTGAARDKPGRFELADGGTILLDEIGDISPALQLRLLRVLQEREIERVGSTRTIEINVRVVAATNQDLSELVERGSFREDLYYRINVVRIRMPPLRERQEDVPLLINHFLGRLRDSTGRSILTIEPETLEALLAYGWPGNIRQLENVLERAMVLNHDGVLRLKDLPSEILSAQEKPRGSGAESTKPLDTQRIREALDAARWNRSRAAKLLGISRTTLWRLMREYGFHSQSD